MSGAGPPRPPGMPAYPQPPGGAKMPPMPPGVPRPPHNTGASAPRGGVGVPPMPPGGGGGGGGGGGAPRYPQPPSGAPMPPMPPGMVAAARPAPVQRATVPVPVDPSAYDPTQGGGGGGGQAPMAHAYPTPPGTHAYPTPGANAYPAPPGVNAYPTPGGNAYPRPPGAAGGVGSGGYGEDQPYRGGHQNYGDGYDDNRRSRGSRYGGGDDDGGSRRGGGGRYRDDSYRDRDRDRRQGGRYSRQNGPRSLIEAPPPREPTNTVWVGNVDWHTLSDARLIETFKEFGMVMQLAKHPDRGYCFVHYRTVEEARSAVEVLSQRGTLAPVVYSYGKMCDYHPEEMRLPFDPNHVPIIHDNAPSGGGMDGGASAGPGMRRSRYPPDDEADHYGMDGGQPPERRRARGEREPLPPTSVLWVGSLPPFVTAATLQDIFSPFGNITRVTRMDKNNIAFVHFETIDECTLALQTMSGRPIEGGAVLALNYGHQPRATERSTTDDGVPINGPGTTLELTPDGYPVNEARTNAIYLGQIPEDATEEEVTALYAAYEGYINCRYVPANAIAFGHYDTVEHALAARVGLHTQLLRGTPLRVMFGKNNHNFTLADREGAAGAPNTDGTMTLSTAGAHAGALTALPARGGGAGTAEGGAAATGPTTAYNRARPAPAETLESRLQTLLGVPYNQCGASGAEISPSQIDDLCHGVDYCVNEKSAAELDQTISLYLPTKATHVFNVVAKRMLEYFKSDPHKRLLILYAITRAMLGASTSESEVNVFNEAALNAYLMVLMVATENQSPSGLDRLTSILESLRHHSFLQKKCLVGQAYAEEFGKHLDDMMERVKAEQDLASLLSLGKGF